MYLTFLRAHVTIASDHPDINTPCQRQKLFLDADTAPGVASGLNFLLLNRANVAHILALLAKAASKGSYRQ